VAATTARAAPARIDATPTARSPAELLLLLLVPGVEAEELDDEPGVDRVGFVVLSPVLDVEVVTEEIMLVVLVDVVGPVLLLLTERYEGAGTAVDGSVSMPVPQGIASPSGWLEFAGGTVAPVESAMANRPVHEWFGDAIVEN